MLKNFVVSACFVLAACSNNPQPSLSEDGGVSSGVDAGNDLPFEDGGALPDAGTEPPLEDGGLPADGGTEKDGGLPSDAGNEPPLEDGGSLFDAGTEPPLEGKTFMTKRGALLFADDFSSGKIAPNWDLIGKGTWMVSNGKLVGFSPPGTTDPNVGHSVPSSRVILQFSFKFTGTGIPGVRFNHQDATNPQHLLAVRFVAPKITINEMSDWATSTKSKVIASANETLLPDQTYTGVIEIYDRDVAFSIDGKLIVQAMTVDQSATPKNHFVLSAYGTNVTYDDVKIWAALLP